TDWDGTQTVCDEGDLEWIKKEDLFRLPMWEGDKIFLQLLFDDAPFFSLKLVYRGDTLVSHQLDM
ncbi:MAG: DNA mismatch repair protein MutT, partial [Clostridia bacterium]|nr:DNA mismatch repair protein MutT [Clostridia bacterium]